MSLLRGAALVMLAAGFPVQPAHAFDCAKAKLPIEKAICADPAAKASDDAMEQAFESVRAAVSGEQRPASLADQRAWLKSRNGDCAQNKSPAACIADANGARTRVLTAQPESGPGLERSPLPFFLRQAPSRTKIDVALQLYKFADPATPGERFLNRKADEAVASTDLTKGGEPGDRDWNSEESWTFVYASPAFLSIRRTTSSYSGGAHGSAGSNGLNIDMKAGRAIVVADLFDKPALARIDALCVKQIRAEKTKRDMGGEEDSDLPKSVAEVVGDLTNWTFTDKQASIAFAQYTVGTYAEGAYDCDLPYAELGTLAKRPLPPR